MLSPAATRITLLTTESSPYDWNFQQVLTDNGIYSSGYRYPNKSVPPKPDN